MAKESRTRSLVIGTAILAGLIGTAILIVSLDALERAQDGTYEAVALVGEAAGVREGTPVWLAGVEAGSVVRVDFLPPEPNEGERVVLSLRLRDDSRALLRRDAEVRVGNPQPLGPPVVQIDPGSRDAPVWAGDTLRSAEGFVRRALMEDLRALRSEGDSLTRSAAALAEVARGRAAGLRTLAEQAGAARARWSELERRLRDGPTAELLGDGDLRQAIERLGAQLSQLRSELAGAAATYGSDSSALGREMKGLERRLDDLADARERLDSLLSEPHGTWPRLGNDPALQEALDAARSAVDSLFTELRGAPHRLFF